MSHIQTIYACLLFWSILGEIQSELLFFVKKVTFSERSTEILKKFVYLNTFEKVNSEEDMDLFKQPFLIKLVKGDKYLKKKVFFTK